MEQALLDEVGVRGRKLYEQTLRALVESGENIGKNILIDVDSGDYEIDRDAIQAGKRLRARQPGARLYQERIGYDAVYSLGGPLLPTKQ